MVCEIDPLVPETLSGNTPVGASTGTEKLTDWVPPVGSVNAELGELVTPAGNPDSVTVTGLLNPFLGVNEMVTAELVFPTTADAETEERLSVKSGRGGGGGGWLLPPPPQATARERVMKTTTVNAVDRIIRLNRTSL